MGVFVNVAVAEGDGDESCAEFVELVTFGEVGVVDAAAVFGVADAADVGDVGFDGVEWLVGDIEEEMESVPVKVLTVFGGPEFVGNGAWIVGSMACMFGELVEELAELLGVDVEVALCGADEPFFGFGCEVEEFVVVGVEPVVGVGSFAP